MTAAADRLRWYANRLRSMSLLEVAHRIEEQAKRTLASRGRYGWKAFDAGDGPLPALASLELARAQQMPSFLAALRRQNAATLGGPIHLLGQAWPARPLAALWHLDPLTGRDWPRDYCFHIPYRANPHYGDFKLVWELNRLQFLVPAAAEAGMRRDAAIAREVLAAVESWIDLNPPFMGMNWISGIELAIRSVSLLAVLACLDHSAIPGPLRRKLRACLAAHAYWLARYPSRHSSANNHLIAEAGGLYLLGTLAPDLPNAARNALYGRRALEEEALRQIHSDGVGAEQSPTYTAFTLEWYLLAMAAAAHSGNPFPAAVVDRVAAAGTHLRWLTDEGGNHPRIGDDDEGRVLPFDEAAGSGYVASVLSWMATALRRPELAPQQATAPQIANLVFGAPPLPHAGPTGVRHFDDGGYTVARGTVAGRQAMLVLDHGPLGYLSIAAHGHADALALWLHIDDQPVLVDAGTFAYNADGGWRDHFRSTAAHNTLAVEAISSSTMAGNFNWHRKARAWRLKDRAAGGGAIVLRHDGYGKPFGLVHEREVRLTGDGYAVIDRLLGEPHAGRTAEVGYLVHPDLGVEADGNRAVVTRDGKPVLEVSGAPGLRLATQAGGARPARGWYSPRFGARLPATRLAFGFDIAPGSAAMTRLRIL